MGLGLKAKGALRKEERVFAPARKITTAITPNGSSSNMFLSDSTMIALFSMVALSSEAPILQSYSLPVSYTKTS